MRFAVIIPAYNEEDLIEDCLQSLLRQTYRNFCAYIIDDASTDSTRQKILDIAKRSNGFIELLEFGKVGPGRARNLAAASISNADAYAFMDADCLATPHWLAELSTGFTTSEVGSTGGPHIAPPQSTPFQLAVEKFYQDTSMMIDFYKPTQETQGDIRETVHNPLCNVAYRRNLFLELQGFREDLFPGEDVEMDFKVRVRGFKITYNPRALVFHHRPEKIEDFRKVMYAYGRAQGKLVREHGIQRRIQAIGLCVLSAAIALPIFLFLIAGLIGLVLASIPLAFLFFFRPRWNSPRGLWVNSASWLNGFIYGFLRNRSDPPGMKR